MDQTTRRQFVGTVLGYAALLIVLSVPSAVAQNQQSVRDLSFFLGRLRTVDHLPELEASHTAMSSTWDRSGGNADGTDFKNVVKPSADGPGRKSVKVKSLAWPLSDTEAKQVTATAQAWLQAESKPPAEPAKWTIDRTATVEAGKAMSIDLPGTGIIRQMRVGIEPATPEVLRGTRMQIKWDQTAEPSVDVPIGHYFGHVDGSSGGNRQDPGVRSQESARQGGSPEGRSRQVRRRDAHRRLALRIWILVGGRGLDDLDG